MTSYGAIVADPPWRFNNVRTGGSLKSGASQKYATLSTADLCLLPVSRIAAKDAILFLWATSPMLEDAFAVMKAWKFSYKGSITWIKTSADSRPSNGLGAWFRNGTEYLLYGIRGKVPALRCQFSNVVMAPRRHHSAKPDTAWMLIERALDGREDLAPKIELFCRGEPRRGWDGWGFETIGGVDLPELDGGLP